MRNNYRPLQPGLTIKNSNIDGLGLFAAKKFKKGHNFGITHIKNNDFQDGYIRTPLGGFYNHSNLPNCEKSESGKYLNLIAIKDIEKGEELTVKYTIYKHD